MQVLANVSSPGEWPLADAFVAIAGNAAMWRSHRCVDLGAGMRDTCVRSQRGRWWHGAALVALAIAGCKNHNAGGSDDGAIALSLSPTSATVQQGDSALVTGTVTRTDFTGQVTINVTGVPSGVAGRVVTPAGTGNGAQVEVSVASTVAPGTYALVVHATGDGVAESDATFTLTVAAATPSSYTMSLAPASISAVQGAAGTAIVHIARSNFSGPITLTADNLPAGVSATFDPSPLTGDSATATITVSSTAPPGSYTNILVRGTATGMTDVTAPLSLTITAPPGFTLAVTPGTVNVAQGANASAGVRVTRTGGFDGAITYSATGNGGGALPSGSSVVVTPVGATDSATVSITASPTIAVGSYTVAIHAAATGVTTQSATITVTVTAPSGSIRLDFSSCLNGSDDTRPLWVAYQDGNGPWTVVAPVGNVYQFNVTSGKFGFAMVHPPEVEGLPITAYATLVTWLTPAEVARLNPCATAVTWTYATVNGSVANVPAGTNNSLLLLGGFDAHVVPPATTWQMSTQPGTWDLIGLAMAGTTPGPTDRMLITRDLSIAGTDTLPPTDFAQSYQVASATMTLTGSPLPDGGILQSEYVTRGRCDVPNLVSIQSFATTPSSIPIYGWPSTAPQRSDDFHFFLLSTAGNHVDQGVSVTTHALTNITLPLGVAINPSITISGTAYKQESATLTLGSSYDSDELEYSVTGPPLKEVTLTQTAGYVGGATSATVAMPDFSGLPGFNTSWLPAVGASTSYQVQGLRGTYGKPTCVDGTISGYAEAFGTN